MRSTIGDGTARTTSEPLRRQGPVTLRDVARRAEVDASVVSRVVNDDPSLRVAPATRRRVEAVIAELGYRPNVQARGLRLARTWTVGIVIPDLMNPFYAPIVEGAEQTASTSGYMVVVVRELDQARHDESELSFERLVHQSRVDGLLVASGRVEDGILRSLAGEGGPLVIVNRRVKGIVGSAIVDDEAAAALATRHLVDLGHRRLGHVGGPAGIDNTERRQRGFESVASEARADAAIVHGEGWGPESGYRAARRLLAEHDVTGVFATNILAAAGIVRAAHERGMDVPRDLSVIGLHDFPVAEFLQPALSTVVLPLERLGSVAMGLLLERIAGRPPRDVVVGEEPELVIRSSSAPPGR